MNEREAILREAHCTAMMARIDRLEAPRLRLLSARIGYLLPDDPLRAAVTRFLRVADAGGHHGPGVADAGDILLSDVLRLLRPAPVDAARKDIHG